MMSHLTHVIAEGLMRADFFSHFIDHSAETDD